jgi:hypothetical protein
MSETPGNVDLNFIGEQLVLLVKELAMIRRELAGIGNDTSHNSTIVNEVATLRYTAEDIKRSLSRITSDLSDVALDLRKIKRHVEDS